MFRRKILPVQLGDRFVKAGDPQGNVWVVVRLWSAGGGIPHARMENLGRQGESRIISVSTLCDRHFFAPATVAGPGT